MDYTIKWELVRNSLNDRLVDNSLLHTLDVDKKINRQTKIFNEKLRRLRTLRSYKHFLSLKQQVLNECSDSEAETDDEPNMDYESFKKYYTDKSYSKSGELQTFLQLCVRMKGRTSYKEKPKKNRVAKQPTVVCKKPARVTGVKNSKPTRSRKNVKNKIQTDLNKYFHRSSEKTSTLSSKEQNLTLVSAKLRPLKTGLFESRDTPLSSIDENNDQDNDRREINNRKKLIDDFAANDIGNEFPNISESMFGNKSTVINDRLAKYHRKEAPSIEPQSTAVTTLENSMEFDRESQTWNDPNGVIEATEDLDAFGPASSSGEIFKEPHFRPEDNLRIIEEEIDRKVEICIPTETNIYAPTSDHDSGNNSLSDTNSLAERRNKRHNRSIGNDNYNGQTVADHYSNVMKENIVPSDELKKTAKKPHGIMKISTLDDNSNISEIKLKSKNSLEKERQTGSDDGAVREELETTQKLDVRLKGESPVENKANKSTSKLKIQKIERHKERYDFLNKLKNIELSKNLVDKVTDRLDKHIENLPAPNSDGDALRYRRSSVSYSFSLNESNHLDGSLGDEISLLIADFSEEIGDSNTDKSLLEDHKQLECKTSSREHDLPEIQLPDSSRSPIESLSSFCTKSYDEEFENCIGKQLLSETETPLEDKKLCNDSNFAKEFNVSLHNEESLSLRIESNEKQDESIDMQPVAESTQLSVSGGLVEKSNYTEVRSHNPKKSSDITNSLPSSKPASDKRSIPSINTDYHMFTSTPSLKKQPRLLGQMSDEQLKVKSCEYKAPEATSCGLQLAENKDDSLNKSDQKLITTKDVKPKRRLRPRTLKEFASAEALCLDVTEPHFRLKSISEDDEIWLLDIPKTIDPQDLKDQTILLGGKGAMILKDKSYKVSSKRSKETCNISCIFATSKRRKEYDIVNVEAQGRIKFTQKHSVIPETKLISAELETVPFPKNIRRRHPLLGTVNENETKRE